MNKFYAYAAGALLAVTSLASCSSSHYAFKAGASPYHDATVRPQVVAEVPQPAVVAPVVIAAAPIKSSPTAPRAVHQTAAVSKMASATQRLNIAQRSVIAKVTARVDNTLRKHQDVSKRRNGMSRAGRAGIVIGVGLVIILIGGLIGGANIVSTIGGVTFLVGLILLIIALVSGN
ncbi:hypothetical protein [Hymenobacter sp. BT730]|uniref:hypothetical protein n=1 Tax=Hymenobacter sp. BT730 TaxID=3063332 RepID=UPI0026DF5121|nr:hypothetical protein [Hymenobacter sp. BT730]